ncbi:MAG: IMP cyclohydrolase [Oscillospiraceae bacterium]|nr:IMP cyclohydrolase [Oscillospiraceae bacterium]
MKIGEILQTLSKQAPPKPTGDLASTSTRPASSKTRKIGEILQANPYPGRGIIMGRNPTGNKAAIAYFIMGRSVNSRNRVFTQSGVHGWDIKTEAFNPSLVTDSSLIIYTPVKVWGNSIIVSNGSQTEEVVKLMSNQLIFQQALQFLEFEPDAPYYTPRITAMMNFRGKGGFDYSMSIVKTAEGNPSSCRRFLYSYNNPPAGQGHFIHTYGNDDLNLPSFSGEPLPIDIDDDIDVFTDTLWNSLNKENRVSLFTRYIHIADGEYTSRIINKNQLEANTSSAASTSSTANTSNTGGSQS